MKQNAITILLNSILTHAYLKMYKEDTFQVVVDITQHTKDKCGLKVSYWFVDRCQYEVIDDFIIDGEIVSKAIRLGYRVFSRTKYLCAQDLNPVFLFLASLLERLSFGAASEAIFVQVKKLSRMIEPLQQLDKIHKALLNSTFANNYVDGMGYQDLRNINTYNILHHVEDKVFIVVEYKDPSGRYNITSSEIPQQGIQEFIDKYQRVEEQLTRLKEFSRLCSDPQQFLKAFHNIILNSPRYLFDPRKPIRLLAQEIITLS